MYWAFGDGPTLSATSRIVSHTYAGKGTFPVTLTVSDAQGLVSIATGQVSVRV